MSLLFRCRATVVPAVIFATIASAGPPVITDVSVSGGEVAVQWSGGSPPYQLERSQNLQEWEALQQAAGTSASFPIGNDGNFFLRVVSSGQPALGEFLGQLRVDEGEFGGPLARHRLKSLWDFHLPAGEAPSAIPEEFFRELGVRLVYRDGDGLATFVGTLGELPSAEIATKPDEMTIKWRFGEGVGRRDFLLKLKFRYNIATRRATIHLSDPHYTLSCDYATPQPEEGYENRQTVIAQTRRDEVSLYELSDDQAPGWWRRSWAIKAGKVSVTTGFLLGVPQLEGSPAFIWKTPLLNQWGSTTITGLTTTPIEITDRFTQTYDPIHHNFVETLWIEPQLHPDLSAETKAELRDADIRFLLATNPTSFPEEKPILRAVGFDLKIRDL